MPLITGGLIGSGLVIIKISGFIFAGLGLGHLMRSCEKFVDKFVPDSAEERQSIIQQLTSLVTITLIGLISFILIIVLIIVIRKKRKRR